MVKYQNFYFELLFYLGNSFVLLLLLYQNYSKHPPTKLKHLLTITYSRKPQHPIATPRKFRENLMPNIDKMS